MLSVSWYAQSLLAHFRGTHTVPVTNSAGSLNPLWWVATIDEPSNAVYLKVCVCHQGLTEFLRYQQGLLKVVNSGDIVVPLKVDFDAAYKGVNGTIIVSTADELGKG